MNYLTIAKCPICNMQHSNMPYKEPAEYTREFTITLQCPVDWNNRLFIATMTYGATGQPVAHTLTPV
jgi:hypothetical protein